MKYFLFSLFIVGLMLAVLGWFFEKAFRFTWLMKKFFPDYLNGLNALELLASDSRLALSREHPGFNVILGRWPKLNNKTSIKFIGRGPAYTEFGPQVKNDFALVAYDENKVEIEPIWTDSSARNTLLRELDHKLFWIGKIIFSIGILTSFSSGLLEFLHKR